MRYIASLKARGIGVVGFALGLLLLGPARAGSETLSLSGRWRFELDRKDAGVPERWFDRRLRDAIQLPGSLPAQGIGDDVTLDTAWTGQIVDRSYFTAPEYAPYRQPDHLKVPFWLQPEKHYVGAAWFQRDIDIPKTWQGKRVVLTLERPHWETRVWLDDQALGANDSLSTPHEYALGPRLAPGNHRLTLRVDNRLVMEVGINAHSVSDHTQGNWNGIVGRVTLHATEPVWIEDLQVYPHVATKSVTVRGTLGNATGRPGSGTVALAVRGAARQSRTDRLPPHRLDVAWDAGGGSFETELPLGAEAQPWDEFNPALYRLTAVIDPNGQGRGATGTPAKEITFGLREIGTSGTQFLVNGRKTFLRGTLECCIFPRTGHPPTDVASWRRLLRAAQAHGLNTLRFHSWCPPEAAFAAADELGVYFHVECAAWVNSGPTVGDGQPIDGWLYAESERIVRAYGNHPSFVLLVHGNEPAGKNQNRFLGDWVNHWKAKDPRRLYSSGAGWPQLPENQFHVTPDPRIQAWGGGLKSRINALPPETRTDYREYIQARPVPVISHEIGQWCAYPNFAEIPKYTGYLKPRNFEIFRDSLRTHGLLDQARNFLLASGKLQTLCYKEDIESALRTPGMGGFQLLDLHDFPGQGTALVGVLDPFWEPKGYVTAAEYRRFCSPTVPLARLSKRVFTTDETLAADLEVAHFGPQPIANAVAAWQLVNEHGKRMAQGSFPARTIPVENGFGLGSLRVPLSALPAPARYRLIVSIRGDAVTHSRSMPFENDWDLWLYPAQAETQPASNILLTETLDASAVAALEAGGRVFLMIPPQRVKGDRLGKVMLGFSSIFWNTAWTARQPPHTLGILCDPKHPALAGFPTEFHSNWQWWYLVSRAGAMILEGLPAELRPTVGVIDDWVTNRRLGLVFEAKVGRGKLLVCSIDLRNGLDRNPVARQLRQSLLRYMASGRFEPRVALTEERVRDLMTGP